MYRLRASEGVVHSSAYSINDDSIDNLGSSLLILQRRICASGGDSGDEGLDGLEPSFCLSFGGQDLEAAFSWPLLPFIVISNAGENVARSTRHTH